MRKNKFQVAGAINQVKREKIERKSEFTARVRAKNKIKRLQEMTKKNYLLKEIIMKQRS